MICIITKFFDLCKHGLVLSRSKRSPACALSKPTAARSMRGTGEIGKKFKASAGICQKGRSIACCGLNARLQSISTETLRVVPGCCGTHDDADRPRNAPLFADDTAHVAFRHMKVINDGAVFGGVVNVHAEPRTDPQQAPERWR